MCGLDEQAQLLFAHAAALAWPAAPPQGTLCDDAKLPTNNDHGSHDFAHLCPHASGEHSKLLHGSNKTALDTPSIRQNRGKPGLCDAAAMLTSNMEAPYHCHLDTEGWQLGTDKEVKHLFPVPWHDTALPVNLNSSKRPPLSIPSKSGSDQLT